MDLVLNDIWSLYFHAKNFSKKYNDNTTRLTYIKTIKHFWETFNTLPKPTEMFSTPGLQRGAYKILKRTGEIPGSISLFRSHSEPTWEHPTNCNGFEWSIRRFQDLTGIDDIWKNILVIVVGENYEHSDILNGVRIVDCTIDDKIMYRIEFWFSNKKYKDYFEVNLKNIFEIPLYTKLIYRDHYCLKEK